MARPLRIEYPGALYHVTSRGNARGHIYRDEQDRENFLQILSTIVKRYHWLVHAYCLMDNHYHLLVETPDANLSKGMRQLNGIYTQIYNRKYHQPGHLFQGRYKAILVDKENYLLELSRYVVLNPLRARCVEHPEQWKWGSYRPTAGLEKVPDYLTVEWILGLFGASRKAAQKHYRMFVRDGIHGTSPWEDLQGQILLGGQGFVDRCKSLLQEKETIKEIPRQQRYAGRPSLQEIFQDTLGTQKQARNEKVYDAHVKYGYTLKEIADSLSLHYSTISKIVQGMEEKK